MGEQNEAYVILESGVSLDEIHMCMDEQKEFFL